MLYSYLLPTEKLEEDIKELSCDINDCMIMSFCQTCAHFKKWLMAPTLLTAWLQT